MQFFASLFSIKMHEYQSISGFTASPNITFCCNAFKCHTVHYKFDYLRQELRKKYPYPTLCICIPKVELKDALTLDFDLVFFQKQFFL